jgi:hypothetical protein
MAESAIGWLRPGGPIWCVPVEIGWFPLREFPSMLLQEVAVSASKPKLIVA